MFSRQIIAECRSTALQNALDALEHSARHLTYTKLSLVFKTFVLSIFEWQLQDRFDCTMYVMARFAFQINCAVRSRLVFQILPRIS